METAATVSAPGAGDKRSKSSTASSSSSSSTSSGAKTKRKPAAVVQGTAGGGAPPKHVSALMLRELDELRGLRIGSPVPTPQPDDDIGSVFCPIADNVDTDGVPYPAIRVDRCPAAAGAATQQQAPTEEDGDSTAQRSGADGVVRGPTGSSRCGGEKKTGSRV